MDALKLSEPVLPPAPRRKGEIATPFALGPNSAPSGMALLKALRRRWALALGLGLLVAGLIGSASWFLVPNSKYTANATLLVASAPKRIVFEPQDNRTPAITYQKTQAALMTDRFILNHALGKPEVARLPTIVDLRERQIDPEEWLGQNLKARFSSGSEILEVSLSGDFPNDLATIINAVLDSYKTLIVDEERGEQFTRLQELEKLRDRYHDDLVAKRKSLEELAGSVGGDSRDELAINRQFKLAQVSLAQSHAMEVNADLLRVQAELKAIEERPANIPVERAATPAPSRPTPVLSEASIERQVERHEDVVALARQVQELAQNYKRNDRNIRQKNDPILRNALRQWDLAKKNLDQLRGRLRQDIRRTVEISAREAEAKAAEPPGFEDPVREAARLRVQEDILVSYKKGLDENLAKLQNEIKSLGSNGVDVGARQEAIDIATEFSRKVGSELEYVKVELNAPPRVRTLARAKPPIAKDDMKKLKLSGLATLGSFAAVLAAVSFWEFRSQRISVPEELVSGLGLRLVGTLPALPNQKRRAAQNNQIGTRWRNLLIESIDSVRTTLLYASQSEGVRVVMITSAVKGEGKTSLACHLATSLARAGRKTLLIDGDMRSPAAHRLLDLPPETGLCEVLRGEALVADVLQPTCAEGLDFMAAGRCDSVALRALACGGLAPRLGELRSYYDFIIVDSAPILPVADSLLIGQAVDAVILAALRDVSRMPAVHAVHERLTSLDIRILGSVFNGHALSSYAGGDYHYYRSAPETLN